MDTQETLRINMCRRGNVDCMAILISNRLGLLRAMMQTMEGKIMTMIMRRTIKRIAKIKKKRRRRKVMEMVKRKIITTTIGKMRIIIISIILMQLLLMALRGTTPTIIRWTNHLLLNLPRNTDKTTILRITMKIKLTSMTIPKWQALRVSRNHITPRCSTLSLFHRKHTLNPTSLKRSYREKHKIILRISRRVMQIHSCTQRNILNQQRKRNSKRRGAIATITIILHRLLPRLSSTKSLSNPRKNNPSIANLKITVTKIMTMLKLQSPMSSNTSCWGITSGLRIISEQLNNSIYPINKPERSLKYIKLSSRIFLLTEKINYTHTPQYLKNKKH